MTRSRLISPRTEVVKYFRLSSKVLAWMHSIIDGLQISGIINSLQGNADVDEAEEAIDIVSSVSGVVGGEENEGFIFEVSALDRGVRTH